MRLSVKLSDDQINSLLNVIYNNPDNWILFESDCGYQIEFDISGMRMPKREVSK